MNVVSDYRSNEYLSYQYTPTGEMWWQRGHDPLKKITNTFSGKE